MDSERKYWSYVRFIKFILLMTGLWPCVTKRSTNIIYQSIAYYSCISIIAIGFAVGYFCWYHHTNLEILMKGVSFFGTVILVLVKILAFIMDRDHISGLMDTLGLLSTTQFEDPKIKSLLLGLLPKLSRYSYVQSVTVAYTLLSFNLIPAMIILQQKLSGFLPITYNYPLPGKFPWDVDGVGGNLYAIHYLFNATASWICFSAIVGPDSLFCLFILQLCGQLRILAFNIRNLAPGNDYDKKFRECIRLHCLLIRCRDVIQRVYGATILTQFISNGFVMCALIFQASQMKTISIGKALTFVFYFAAKFVQALMYSWCGTLLTTESEAVSDAAFDSDWMSLLDPKTMRNVLIVISQRPLILTACHFSVVSLNMLSTILNTAVSYYFLLKTVEEK